jgi:hypothetical protein
MKATAFCLIVLTAFLNFSCGQNVESSPVAINERAAETPRPTPTPDKFEEIDLQAKFSKMENDDLPDSLKIDGYEVKTVTVKKRDGFDSPEADIYDLVLSKKGKSITRFEGMYYPLGNYMSFGLFSFLGGSEQQLLAFDESYKWERDWIISLTPRYEVLFDSHDYGIGWGRIGVVDVDQDGVYELTELQSIGLNIAWANSDYPWVKVIFKYDSRIHKFTPANHIFTSYSLDSIDEQLKQFKDGQGSTKRDFLEIMLRYFYAGKDSEAWRFFDENFAAQFTNPVADGDKEKTIELIKKALAKDPIYRFVKSDILKDAKK